MVFWWDNWLGRADTISVARYSGIFPEELSAKRIEMEDQECPLLKSYGCSATLASPTSGMIVTYDWIIILTDDAENCLIT